MQNISIEVMESVEAATLSGQLEILRAKIDTLCERHGIRGLERVEIRPVITARSKMVYSIVVEGVS